VTNEEINRRVAVAMKWSGLEDAETCLSEMHPAETWADEYTATASGWYGWEPGAKGVSSAGGFISECADKVPTPDFCRDPAAADLVRLEIERMGWMLTRIDYKSERSLPAYPSQHRAQILTGGVLSEGHWGADDERPGRALCLAFLAACEAQEGGEE
jgi:hypothetical protein